ncbi:MAG: hypothetical protein BGO30_07070 [Bacteroidetes bacterium 41-46]|nr:MAG: hypothetical protein BGO30_07070 [Bacteroidetes bacterium 41-46]
MDVCSFQKFFNQELKKRMNCQHLALIQAISLPLIYQRNSLQLKDLALNPQYFLYAQDLPVQICQKLRLALPFQFLTLNLLRKKQLFRSLRSDSQP